MAADGQSNETTAVPALLGLLSLPGLVVTADVRHCQRATAAQIVVQGGDYVLALKANQGTLPDDVRHLLDDSPALSVATHTEVDKGHGRIETRPTVVSKEIAWLPQEHAWPGLAAVGKLKRTREVGEESSTETAYLVLSAPVSAERFAQAVRQHWGVENRLCWVWNVTMNEDQARQRKDHGPENRALLRRWALNVARLESSRGSIKGKRQRAGWDNAYLTQLLARFASPYLQ